MSREIVTNLDQQFAALVNSLKRLASSVPAALLYRNPPAVSIGESILRSAAAIEQTCGGLTSNLWDDPFEWTLPEALPTPAHVAEYLSEAEATRLRAFQSFRADSDLSKEIATPSGEMMTVFALVAETLARAAHHQGRAYATFRLFSEERLPRV